jgi:hypothetical protein
VPTTHSTPHKWNCGRAQRKLILIVTKVATSKPEVNQQLKLPTKRTIFQFVLLTLLAATPSLADQDADDDAAEDFDVPGVNATTPGSVYDLDDANTALNPFQKLSKSWPEDLVVAPVPAYSAQLGWSLTLGAAYFLDIGENNRDVSPSAIGGFAMTAQNGSYAYGGGAYLHLLDDKLRIKTGAAYIDVRYRLYGIGNTIDFLDIDVLQEIPAYFLSGSWNVWKKLYIGLGYLRGTVDTRLRFVVTPPLFFDPAVKLDLGALTIPIQIDSRDHEQFPRDGWFITGKTVLYREAAGSDVVANTYQLSANRYLPMRDADVLATRLMIKSTDGDDVPFFLLSTFGGTEYRWQFSDRWIFTGFVGVGEVAQSFSEMGRNFLPAGGIGARFILSEKHKVGLSVDLAAGNDGMEFYFGVGEAF